MTICGGGEPWVRQVNPCPYCKGKRRFLYRLELSGYGSRAICGGCGNEWSDGEARRGHKEMREKNRALVRAEWPRATGDLREQMKALLEEGTT